MTLKSFITLCCAFSLIALPYVSSARETDPFMAATYQLADSQIPLTEFMMTTMESGLAKVNSQKSTGECLNVAKDILLSFRQLAYQKTEAWADFSDLVDRAPSRDEMSDIDYIHSSYLTVSPFNIPMARTINVGGIYLGSDKLGHFTSWGLRYLNVYRQQLKKGSTHEEAMKAAIRFGHLSEHSLLGKWSTNVASYGDLEANFQGMTFALDLCRSDTPYHLQQEKNGKWELVGALDMMRYIDLDWDEFYNNSIIAPHFAKRVVSKAIVKYCPLLSNPMVQDRYNKLGLTYRPSFSKTYLREIDLKQFGHDLRSEFSLKSFCEK